MRSIKVILSLILVITALSCNVFENFERSGMQLSHERANALYTEFNENLKPIVQANRNTELKGRTQTQIKEKFKGTEYVWISKQRLQTYLDLLNALDAKNGEDPITGISIYFGRNSYEDELIVRGDEEENILKSQTILDFNTPVKKGDYRGRLTVFFAPTIRVDCIEGDEMLKHKAFYIEPKDDNPKNKYVGDYKLIDFLFDVPYGGSTAGCEKYFQGITGSEGDKDGEVSGTSVLGNDVNNMPPMSGPGSN